MTGYLPTPDIYDHNNLCGGGSHLCVAEAFSKEKLGGKWGKEREKIRE